MKWDEHLSDAESLIIAEVRGNTSSRKPKVMQHAMELLEAHYGFGTAYTVGDGFQRKGLGVYSRLARLSALADFMCVRGRACLWGLWALRIEHAHPRPYDELDPWRWISEAHVWALAMRNDLTRANFVLSARFGPDYTDEVNKMGFAKDLLVQIIAEADLPNNAAFDGLDNLPALMRTAILDANTQTCSRFGRNWTFKPTREHLEYFRGEFVESVERGRRFQGSEAGEALVGRALFIIDKHMAALDFNEEPVLSPLSYVVVGAPDESERG